MLKVNGYIITIITGGSTPRKAIPSLVDSVPQVNTVEIADLYKLTHKSM